MNNTLGFLIGLCAGVGVGVLLAPRSGEKTRSMIQERANEGAAYLRRRGAEAREAATEAIRQGTSRAAQQAEAVKAAVEAGKSAYADSLQS